MSNTTSNIATAASYREQAADCYKRSLESFDRCDTDGFLSQWAADKMASTYISNAEIVEQGYVRSLALVEIATGEIVASAAQYLEGQYGWYYLISDDAVADRLGRFVTPSSASKAETRDKNNAKKGVREVATHVPLADCYESRKTGRIEVFSYDNATLEA